MNITEYLTVETELPLKAITELSCLWRLDEHAALRITGIADSRKTDEVIRKDYQGSMITAAYCGDTLFCGLVEKTEIRAEGRLFRIEITSVSASKMLDVDIHNEMFQDCSVSYKQMIQKLTEQASGKVICTIGEEGIRTPRLCYKETVWQYAKRMAGVLGGHLVPDIKTGKPCFWFGLRRGRDVEEHDLIYKEIELRKSAEELLKGRICYRLEGGENYELCDRLRINGRWNMIGEKEARLECGELRFTYTLAEESSFSCPEYRRDDVTGLSLKGVVERTEREHVYVKLDIDQKEGVYPFPWLPETGNVLYAMPEAGAEIELYFMQGSGPAPIGVRCRDSGGKKREVRKMTLPNQSELTMDRVSLHVSKKSRMDLFDHDIGLSSDQAIEIIADERLKIEGKRIGISTANKINYITSW